MQKVTILLTNGAELKFDAVSCDLNRDGFVVIVVGDSPRNVLYFNKESIITINIVYESINLFTNCMQLNIFTNKGKIAVNYNDGRGNIAYNDVQSTLWHIGVALDKLKNGEYKQEQK
jgi:hypothetical protein